MRPATSNGAESKRQHGAEKCDKRRRILAQAVETKE